MENQKYGKLLTPDIKIHRQYFREMIKLLGIRVLYRAPKPGKTYTTYREIDASYEKPIMIGCIFDEHPTQQTLNKMGWISELQENASIIHIPYDTPYIQQGALFEIPSGIDNAPNRLFRVSQLSNIMIYPASIACEIVPEYENTYQESQNDFKQSSFNLLKEEDYHL